MEHDQKPSTWQRVVGFLPRLEIIRVLANYPKDWTDKLAGDLASGMVVAVMLVPQGMAYSILAGLPPMYGLYSSIFSLLLYAPFSTSPPLAVGPVAMMSLLSSAAVGTLGDYSCEDVGSESCSRYIEISHSLALLVGFFSLLLGLLKAGYLVNFLSHPVLKGFTFAAALIIGSSQIGKVLGFKIPRHHYVYETWYDAVKGIVEGEVHTLTFLLFVENMVLFYLLKYVRTWLRSHPCIKRTGWAKQIVNAFPSALVVVIVNILIVSGARLDEQGVGIVGKIESGIPAPRNAFGGNFWTDAPALAASAFVMAIVGFMESISVAKAMALRFGTRLSSDQELVGLGVANFGGSFFNAFGSAGGFSRTTVNADAGAKTPLAGVVSALVLIIVVVFLTGLFEFLPNVTLGSMIIFAVTKLIEFTTPRMLWAVDKNDFVVYLVSLLATILLGIELGIGVGAAISLARVIKEAALPHIAVLGRMPGSTNTWRNVKRFPDKAKEEDGVKVLRFDSPLFFANSVFFQERILKLARQPMGESGTLPRAIVVDFSAITTVDSSAIHMLEALPDELRKQAKQRKEARVRELRRMLNAACSGPDCGLSEEERDAVTRLNTPRFASVDEYHPAKSRMAPVPLRDDDVDAANATALAERLRLVVSSPPNIPVLFLACVRGPVRDVFERNDFFEDCEEARQRFVKGNMWRCEHPCRVVAPHSLLFVGCRRVPGMPTWEDHHAGHGDSKPITDATTTTTAAAAKQPSAVVPGGAEALHSSSATSAAAASSSSSSGSGSSGAGEGDDDAAAAGSDDKAVAAHDAQVVVVDRTLTPGSLRPRTVTREEEHSADMASGPAAMTSFTAYPLLQMVMQQQDIGEAVAHVTDILHEVDRMAAAESTAAASAAAEQSV